jgi:hypothetical protein
MQRRFISALAIGCIAFGVTCMSAQAAATDALTGLPVFPGMPFTMKLPDSSYCGTAMQGNMYMPVRSISKTDSSVDAIDRWYATHLPGFHLIRGFSDRTQDTFSKPDLTAEVTVTGEPDKSGGVYAISYMRFAKPMTPAAMASLNSHIVACK